MDNKEKINLISPDFLIFTSQVILIFIVVITSLINLTFQWGNLNLWTVILTGSLGYIMPNPKLRADIHALEIEEKTKQTNL